MVIELRLGRCKAPSSESRRDPHAPACGIFSFDDVGEPVVDDDLDPDVGVGFQDVDQARLQRRLGGMVVGGDPHMAK